MLKWKIGDITISQLIEMTPPPAPIIPDATPEAVAVMPWLKPFLDDNDHPRMNIQMMIIETPEQKLVVDTCIGNDKQINMEGWSNMQLPFLENLTAMGHDPDSIDTVICTHLHVDHVGWNTRKVNGLWVPTFRNARYLAVEEEFVFWRDIEHDPYGPMFDESVRPVNEAGLIDIVQNDHRVSQNIWYESTPGHTPGHISVHVSSGQEHAIITGDVMHHPCQIGRPEWATPFDVDVEQARETRRNFLDRYADEPVLILGTHFPNPVSGKITRDGDTYRFDH